MEGDYRQNLRDLAAHDPFLVRRLERQHADEAAAAARAGDATGLAIAQRRVADAVDASGVLARARHARVLRGEIR